MAAPKPRDPLDALQALLNDVVRLHSELGAASICNPVAGSDMSFQLVQTGKALRASRRDSQGNLALPQGMSQSKLPVTIDAFQKALDDLEGDIVRYTAPVPDYRVFYVCETNYPRLDKSQVCYSTRSQPAPGRPVCGPAAAIAARSSHRVSNEASHFHRPRLLASALNRSPHQARPRTVPRYGRRQHNQQRR